MFQSELDWNGTNKLRGLKMLIDDHVTPNTVMAEIGSFSGASSELFALHCKEINCIDEWKPYWEVSDSSLVVEAERRFDEMSIYYDNIIKRKFSSVEAATLFPDEFFDLVYIDAAHDMKNVVNDIKAWWPKVKIGGILAGHDYHYDPNIKVYEVVNDLLGQLGKIEIYPDSSWAVKRIDAQLK